MEDTDKERIKFQIEVARLCVVGMLTIGAGVVRLISETPIQNLQFSLIAMGIILLVVQLIFLYRAFKILNKLIK